MATTRLVVGLLALGILLLLGLQNWSPSLPLVFLGGRTLALPVGLWLVLAILLGALTTLAMNAIVGPPNRGESSRNRYKYEPQPFYEPANPNESSRPSDFDRRQGVRSSADAAARSAVTDGSWRDWTDLQSPTQWNSWDDHRRPEPEPQRTPAGAPPRSPNPPPPPAVPRSPLSWFGRRQDDGPDPRVQESLREITDDWDDVDPRPYRPSGVSPVEESLEEITEGWDDIDGRPASYGPESRPTRDYDVPKPPTQVYRDGSIYSYSYREQAGSGQTDRIYAPPDDVYDNSYNGDAYDDEDSDAPDLDDEGVVDADFRVIIPPPPDGSTEGTA
ncbi:hypothetical protein [Phormidium sp. FACHB-1136]|uniref:hypothetical protein n=1 Tax=Phormidium sp. FACHB-1136 TaxID=2692848 RepID=UPI001681FC5B|nr:hypothetical protein [Phormidium sp. FACHB-1136]MBD2426011.1 hypothetical protein [Phormidium sp. FACHB-1136]